MIRETVMDQQRRPTGAKREWTYIAVPLALSTLSYASITRNYFILDDFQHFYLFLNQGLARFLIAPHGGHFLMVPNFIWWLLYRTVGLHAEVYFATVLATHLLAVGLLFAAAYQLTGSARAACVAASLWGSAPVHEGALGWYSVYGQVLATAILAWLLYRLAQVATGAPASRSAPLRWGLLLLTAAASFGVGIGMALVFPLVAYLVMPPSRTRRVAVITLLVVSAIVPILYRAAFLLSERLYGGAQELPVSNAGLQTPGLVVNLLVRLSRDGVAALLAAPFTNSADVAGPYAAALAIVFGLIVAIVLVRAPARDRRVVLAGVVLSFACYTLIALGRAPFALYGSLEAFAHVARYHYAATLPLALVVAVVLARASDCVRVAPVMKDASVWIFAAGLMLHRLWWLSPIDHHEAARRETEATVSAIRSAIDSAPPAADAYIDNQRFAPIGLLLGGRMDLFPGWAGVFVIFFPEDTVDGRRVYFVSDPAVVAAAPPGSRAARILVARSQVPKE